MVVYKFHTVALVHQIALASVGKTEISLLIAPSETVIRKGHAVVRSHLSAFRPGYALSLIGRRISHDVVHIRSVSVGNQPIALIPPENGR